MMSVTKPDEQPVEHNQTRLVIQKDFSKNNLNKNGSDLSKMKVF
jgi:hypothetical protein